MSLGENWGASEEERALPMACDELLAGAPVRLHRAVSVDAPPSIVFRWLCQLKLAPYSYDLLDNFGRRSPRQLVDGVADLQVGQRFMTIFTMRSFAEDEHITLRGRGVAVTYRVLPAQTESRLLARVLFRPPGARLGARISARTLALADLLMMRKQLLTLKQLAERDAAKR